MLSRYPTSSQTHHPLPCRFAHLGIPRAAITRRGHVCSDFYPPNQRHPPPSQAKCSIRFSDINNRPIKSIQSSIIASTNSFLAILLTSSERCYFSEKSNHRPSSRNLHISSFNSSRQTILKKIQIPVADRLAVQPICQIKIIETLVSTETIFPIRGIAN